MRRHSRAATACCFILFLAVFMAQKMVPGTFAPGAGSMDLVILSFMLPGAVAGVCARRGRELKPLAGALIAAPLCLVLLHLWGGSALLLAGAGVDFQRAVLVLYRLALLAVPAYAAPSRG